MVGVWVPHENPHSMEVTPYSSPSSSPSSYSRSEWSVSMGIMEIEVVGIRLG